MSYVVIIVRFAAGGKKGPKTPVFLDCSGYPFSTVSVLDIDAYYDISIMFSLRKCPFFHLSIFTSKRRVSWDVLLYSVI